MIEMLWAALAGSMIYLDTTAVAQFMICQPLVTCPLWGVLVGRPEVGLFFGVIFQLLWLGNLPVGAAKFPEGNIGGFIATVLAARIPPTASGDPAWLVMAIAALIGIVVAHFGSEVTPLVRRIMGVQAPKLTMAAQEGRIARFRFVITTSIAVHAVAGFLLSLAAFLIGKWIFALYLGDSAIFGVNPAIVQQTDDLLRGLWPGLLGVGVAVFISRFTMRKTLQWFGPALLLGLTAGWLWL